MTFPNRNQHVNKQEHKCLGAYYHLRDFCATVISSEIKKPSLWFQKPIFQFIFKKIYCVFLHLISHPFVSSWCERQYCFCVPVAPAETFSPAAFSPTTFQLSVPDEHMYILQWAWVLDEERCESFWLFNVCYIKEPLFQLESQLCGAILNWDWGAESGFAYERRGISQGHKNRKGHGAICNYSLVRHSVWS